MPKINKVIQSLNSGELSPLLDQRIDQEKYNMGCRTMENAYPLIYGGAERRPGTQFIASQKTQSAKGMLVGFDHSVDDTYVLLFENQVIRVFKDGEIVNKNASTGSLSGFSDKIAHWKLDEDTGTAIVDSFTGTSHNGTATVDAGTLSEIGKVGSGCFDLDGQYTVEIADHADLSFTDNSSDSAFSINSWGYVSGNELQNILSKWKTSGSTREWRFSLNSLNNLQLELADTSKSLSGDMVAQWYLNDDAANTHIDDVSTNHDAVSDDKNTADITATGKINACLDFSGDQAGVVGDDAALSFGNGTTDSAFSISAWVYVTTYANQQTILCKFDRTTGSEAREWSFYIDPSGKLVLYIVDESVGSTTRCKLESDDALVAGWRFVVGTYDGSGGATAANGMTLYVDNVEVDSTATNDANYVAMENLGASVIMGADTAAGGSLGHYFQDKMDNIILFDVELTTSNVSALWNSGEGTESLAGSVISAVADVPLEDGWHMLSATYDAENVAYTTATAANYIKLYVDGSLVASTKINDPDYVAMQNGAEEVRIGANRNSADTANVNFFQDKLDDVSVFSDVLTPAELASLTTTEPYEITTPYLTADLLDLDIKQSADVMFISHDSYEPVRLSRLGDKNWTLSVEAIQDGPFREANADTAKTIAASATTGSVTLTASGHEPFAIGATTGHAPTGSSATSKSQTGSLFKLVHAEENDSIDDTLTDSYDNDTALHTSITSEITVYKGVTWDFTTNGTWTGTLKLEKEYGNSGIWETVVTVVGVDNKNVEVDDTEEVADAQYRIKMHSGCTSPEDCEVQFSVRNTSHIGIVEITSVESPTSATGTVLTTIGSTDATHRWSEGSWNNYRGWPRTVEISPEERLTYSGSTSKPLTSWGSAVGEYKTFKEGILDDDAATFTLIGSGQQNIIQWAVPRSSLMFGTVGGEHLLGASSADEALTPTNVTAKLKGTRGSERLQAMLVNDAILFLQRGGRKVRELSNIDTYDASNYRADDLTVFSNHITESGIVDWAYQRSPDPMLWCVRDDGEIAVMMYEKQQDIFSWSRIVLAGTDAKAESVAVIYGGASSEDEVWITVSRTVDGSTIRNVERFKSRDWGSTLADAFFVDSGITDTGGDTTITGLDHLEGETVQVFGDGLEQATQVVFPSATSHFLMNETTGTTIADAEGSDDGTSANNASTMTIAGKVGTALDFNGTDDVVTITDSTSFDFSTAMSVCGWFKPTTLTNGDGYISKHTTAGSLREWSMLVVGTTGNSAKIVIYIGASGGATVTTETTDDFAVEIGKWAHVGFTYNAGVVKIYINGTLVDSTTSGTHITSLNNEAVDIKIGLHESNYYNGIIDDVRIYGSVLTASVVSSLYNSGSGTESLGGAITAATAASKYQVGLGYNTTVQPMKLNLEGLGLVVKKKVTEGTLSFYKTIGGEFGNKTSNMYDIDYKNAGSTTTTLFTGDTTIPFDGGYERSGDVIIRQTGPLPMTILSLSLDLGAHNY